MFKKLLSVVVTLSLVLAVSGTAAATQENLFTTSDINIAGISMDADTFARRYSGEPTKRNTAALGKSIQSSLLLEDVVIKGNVISFLMKLRLNNDIVTFKTSGTLYAGHKAQHGFNSIIVSTENTINDYEILLFEIFNDVTGNEQLINSLTGAIEGTTKPFIKVYIQDSKNNIYLYETDLPKCFENLDANDYDAAAKEKDLLWASHLVEHSISEIPVNDQILEEFGLLEQSRGLGNTTRWTPGTVYIDSFYVAGNRTVCFSMPYLDYKHTNVTTATSTWTAEFYVAEHTESAGYTFYGSNVYEYRNLKIVFTRGDNTHILRTLQEGRLYEYNALWDKLKELGEKATINLLERSINKLPGGATINQALTFINAMYGTSTEVTLGSSGFSLLPSTVTAAGEELTRFSIEESSFHGEGDLIGHYFILHADVNYEYENSTINTTGGLYLEFDKYYVTNDTLTPVRTFIPLEYTARNT